MAKAFMTGIRVLDFGSFIAGPAAGMMMAHLGAEVIKMEHPRRPEPGRFFVNAPKAPLADPKYGGQWFDVNNAGKKSLTVDYSKPEGRDIVLEIAKTADVWMENMPPGTIAKYGLGYEDIKKIRPSIIYLSSCASGQDGPERDYIGFATHFANMVGMGTLTGYPDQPPSQFVGSMDARSAANAVIAVLSALIYREKSGNGQYIDLASQEVIAAELGDVYLDCIINGHEQIRTGNHRMGYAPNNAYRCRGEDTWIAVAVRTQDEWENLCKAIGRPDLLHNVRYATAEKRFAYQEELDAILSDWAKDYEDREAMFFLQKQGVPATYTTNGKTFYQDEHVRARQTFTYIDHPKLGKDFICNPCWRFSKTPAVIRRHAPVFGEHTDELLKGIGITEEKIAQLRESGIV
jgi:crotonobetainyl-CoA:carnitine CoA-transferase CaiB-like acyl-CoA transferase